MSFFFKDILTPVYIFFVAVESKLLKARIRMQQKYIGQFYMLYDDFHITKLPLLPEEVAVLTIGKKLLTCYYLKFDECLFSALRECGLL